MISYELSLQGQNLLGSDKFSVAAQSNDSVQLHFHFDRSWRLFDSKAAIFRDSKHKYYVIDIIGSIAKVPWEVLRTDDGFDLAVVAYDESTVYTSKRVKINVASSLMPEFCRQLSPTETLFDRIREDCKAEVMHEYKEEIRRLNEQHADDIADLMRSNNVLLEEKDNEISELISNAESAELRHIEELSEISEQLEIAEAKAKKWEMVDTAISQKTVLNFQLWNGGSAPFELPMLNLPLVTSFNGTYISTLLTKIGMYIPSATSISDAFSSKSKLREVVLKGTNKITSLYNTFNNSSSLQYVDIESIPECTTIENSFKNCTSLKKIHLGNADKIRIIQSAFSNCQSLEEIDGTLNTSACISFNDTFYSCGNLKTIRFAENCIKANIDFSSSPNLTKESVYSIVKGLSTEKACTLRLSASVFSNTLTDEQAEEVRAAVARKNWTLVS